MTVQAAFMETRPNYYNAQEYPNFIPFNGTQRQAAIQALQLWQDVANINITVVSNPASVDNLIFFGTTAPGGLMSPGAAAHAYFAGGSNPRSGDVWLNNTYSPNASPSPGNYGFLTLVHEIGHALGLKHPGNYDAGGNIAGGPVLPQAEDNRQYSVMSYNRHPNGGAEPSTPMLYDIAAVQFLYGANMTTRTGNDTYSLGTDENRVFAIWDAGGIDTLDASNQTRGAILNLNEGSFSSIGANEFGAAARNNVAIAYGATIENARGSAASDTLIGNAANNLLQGGGGADRYIFVGPWGNDRIDDASSADSVEFNDLTFSGLNISRDGRDLVFAHGGSSDRLTVAGYFASATGSVNLNWHFLASGLEFQLPNVAVGGGDDSVATARPIGQLSIVPTIVSDDIGPQDTQDFWRINVTEGGLVDIRLSGLRADANLELVTGSGETIAASRNGGTAAESISQFLDAGVYFLRVFGATPTAATSYDLSVQVRPTVGPNNADNTRDGARDLGTIDTRNTQDLLDFVGRSDPVDFYRFTLGDGTILSLRLSGLDANADLQLLNAQGAVLASSQHGGTDDDAIERSLAAGDYFVRVNAAAGLDTSYHLLVSGTTIASDGAGNSRDEARQVGTLDARTRPFNDFISGAIDTNDFYRVTVNGASAFSARLSGLSANADIQLQDGQGRVIASSQHAGTDDESIALGLIAGDYFLRVFPAGSAETNYRLEMSGALIANDAAGNDRDTALFVGTLDSRLRSFNDFVSNTLDHDDFYPFTLIGAAAVTLRASNLSADATLQLQDAQGRVIVTSNQPQTSDETIV
ncbi:MAG: pre-peptidase C-terminal domain-containing protein, partial [Proteobacteria bacterium]|nr:pre-peptidase C-terminal domain-containing protein [Pseudomonadota bacterium]